MPVWYIFPAILASSQLFQGLVFVLDTGMNLTHFRIKHLLRGITTTPDKNVAASTDEEDKQNPHMCNAILDLSIGTLYVFYFNYSVIIASNHDGDLLLFYIS